MTISFTVSYVSLLEDALACQCVLIETPVEILVERSTLENEYICNRHAFMFNIGFRLCSYKKIRTKDDENLKF